MTGGTTLPRAESFAASASMLSQNGPAKANLLKPWRYEFRARSGISHPRFA
jgi:hypothetical protein